MKSSGRWRVVRISLDGMRTQPTTILLTSPMPMSTFAGRALATSSTALERSRVASAIMATEVMITALPVAGRFSGTPGYQVISDSFAGAGSSS